jgi:hypothetical protein
MDQVYAYPLLRLLDDDPPLEVRVRDNMTSDRRLTRLQQIHKTLTALRELWNTRNTLNFDLPWGELDGCRFGLKAVLDLLEQPGCERFSRLTSEEISQRIHKTIISTDASKQMAEFVRWATDCYMGF